MIYTEEQRKQISATAEGKTIRSMEWDDVDKYWVITFTDESEITVRLMSELV